MSEQRKRGYLFHSLKVYPISIHRKVLAKTRLLSMRPFVIITLNVLATIVCAIPNYNNLFSRDDDDGSKLDQLAQNNCPLTEDGNGASFCCLDCTSPAFVDCTGVFARGVPQYDIGFCDTNQKCVQYGDSQSCEDTS
jgi:hypothetical protein